MGEAVERVSYDAYLEMLSSSEVKLEFVDGVVYAMSGGTVEHARLSAAVAHALTVAFRGSPCAVFSSDLAIRVDATNRTTFADAVVICGPEQVSTLDRNAVTNPTVIVEVLSPSTEASDRGAKFRHYQRLSSLQEYVLVSQNEVTVEVFQRRPQSEGEGEAWILRTFHTGESFVLPSQDVEVSVDALYADPRST